MYFCYLILLRILGVPIILRQRAEAEQAEGPRAIENQESIGENNL